MRSPFIKPRRFRPSIVLLLVATSWCVSVQARDPDTRLAAVHKRAPAPVLLVDDHDTPEADAWYTAFMDMMFGEGTWDRYDVDTQGFPDPPAFFLNTLAQYQAVLWHVGGGSRAINEVTGPILDYVDPDTLEPVPGRYQLMSNGDFDVGVTAEEDFTIVSGWSGLLATGPFSDFAAGDTITVIFALVGGKDAWHLRRNGKRIQDLAHAGYVFDASSVGRDTPSRAWLGAAPSQPLQPLDDDPVSAGPSRLDPARGVQHRRAPCGDPGR